MSKTVKIVIGAALVVVLAGGAGVWYFVLRDTAEKTASLESIGGAATTTPGGATKTTPDGTWKVEQATGVFVGYRMEEQFAAAAIKKTATGRTPAVEGSMKISGSTVSDLTVKADVTKLKSDEDRRDAQIRNRGLETAKIGEATFKLTSPVTLPGTPTLNSETTVTAKGDLTLHGVTKPVEVPLKATWTGSQIKVATAGEGVAILLADYKIDKIDVAGFVTIDEKGFVELQLLFVPA